MKGSIDYLGWDVNTVPRPPPGEQTIPGAVPSVLESAGDSFPARLYSRPMKKLLVLTALVLFAVPATAGSTASERATKTVGAYNNYFSPKSIKVKRGTKVTWVIRKGVHNVRSKKGSFLASKNLGKGGKYSKKFSRSGSYPYVCTLHPGMDGKVTVR